MTLNRLLSASHIRVMPGVRFDGAGHIMLKRKEQRRCSHDGFEEGQRLFCTRCNMTLCIERFTVYHKKGHFVLVIC
jgi:hypothetical protein